jgi:hypothetical protein
VDNLIDSNREYSVCDSRNLALYRALAKGPEACANFVHAKLVDTTAKSYLLLNCMMADPLSAVASGIAVGTLVVQVGQSILNLRDCCRQMQEVASDSKVY